MRHLFIMHICVLTLYFVACDYGDSKYEEGSIGDSIDNSNEDPLTSACAIGSGCTHWFDGDDSSTLFSDVSCTTASNDTDNVRCWENKGSNAGENISRAAGFVPTYAASAINSKGGITKTAGASAATFFHTDVDPLMTGTYFIVFNVTGHSGANYWLFGNGNSGAARTGVQVDNSGSVITYFGENTVTYSATNVINSTVLLSVLTDGANFKVYLNGNLVGTNTIGTIDTTNDIAVFSLWDGASVFNGAGGFISEFVIYSTELSNSDREEVEEFLESKWGI